MHDVSVEIYSQSLQLPTDDLLFYRISLKAQEIYEVFQLGSWIENFSSANIEVMESWKTFMRLYRYLFCVYKTNVLILFDTGHIVYTRDYGMCDTYPHSNRMWHSEHQTKTIFNGLDLESFIEINLSRLKEFIFGILERTIIIHLRQAGTVESKTGGMQLKPRLMLETAPHQYSHW